MKKLNYDFEKKSKSAKEEFIKFAQTTWIEEITNDNLGSLLQNEWTKTLKMDAIFKQVNLVDFHIYYIIIMNEI